MVHIDISLEQFIREAFPKREVYAYCKSRTRQTSRYLYVTTVLKDDNDLHYEYIGGQVELHLEGKYQSNDYKYFTRKIKVLTFKNKKLQWIEQGRCQMKVSIANREQLVEAFKELMDIFDPIIAEIKKQKADSLYTRAYDGDIQFSEEYLDKDEVCLAVCKLGKLFSNKLVIPDYQRNYCWEDKQIIALWESLKEIPQNGEYHLGTIILQKDADGNYAIIDGQQRLVTLTLIAYELNYQGDLPLLKQKFLSSNSKKHIANTRWLIKQLTFNSSDDICKKIINNLTFTTLILKESRLDLAYTFFSNENSKGVPLSDYDLLKAHHLRYIFIDKQAEHLASKWNDMIEKEYSSLNKTLAAHLFQLRKWMRKKSYNPDERFCVKEEFSSAYVIPEIPPFGEKFYFYEKIQGGTHFFAYVEHFVNKYNQFSKTKQVIALRKHLQGESHWKYADMIEALLFGYYLKFGEQYLTEALYCISGYMAQHRYESTRALTYKIREYACNSEIIMMIDQASSPTFFLSECLYNIKNTGKELEDDGIAIRFYLHLQDLYMELYNDFTDSTIKTNYDNEYV